MGPNAQIIADPSLLRPKKSAFSFERVIIPLLRVLTSDQIRKSVMSEWINQLFSVLHNMEHLELRLVTLFEEVTSCPDLLTCESSGGSISDMDDAVVGSGIAPLFPSCWADVALPIALLMREVANRIKVAAAKPDFQQAFDLLERSVEAWEAHDPSNKRIVRPVMKTIKIRIDAIRSQLARGEEVEREKERMGMKKKGAFAQARGGAAKAAGKTHVDIGCICTRLDL